MSLARGLTTALRGTAAADLGRGLLERATDGGPLSTRQPVQGNVPKVRQVRVPEHPPSWLKPTRTAGRARKGLPQSTVDNINYA